MPQPSLRELQSWLRWIITDPRGVPEALKVPHPGAIDLSPFRFVPNDRDRAVARYHAPSTDCLSAMQESERFLRQERLSVYAEAYFTRISQSLAEDFQAVSRLVGEEGFEQLIADYLKEHPSRYENLGEVGRHFPAFLARHEAAEALPYLVDLADLEWLLVESYHADDVPPMDLAALQQIAPEQWQSVTFVLDPSLRLLASPWNVDLFWSKDAEAIEACKRFLIVFREDGEAKVHSVEYGQFAALQMAASGKTLGEVCSHLEESEIQGGAAGIQEWFGGWIGRGIIRQVRC